MNKFYSMIMTLALTVVSMGAQAQDVPNRLIVNSPVGSKAYAVDQVNNITFARKEGEVKAKVEVLKYEKTDAEGDVVTVKVTRTDKNSTFMIDVLPTNTAKQYDDTTLASYFAQQSTAPKFSEDFSEGKLSGFAREFTANTSYTVVTMAYDEYGVPCQASRAEFKTPKVPTVGNPSVTYTIDDYDTSSFTLTVTPNKDCAEFYWCQFDKGDAEKQFEQWGPMMGLSNIESMVQQFSGQAYQDETTYTWKDLAPGKDYEVLVLPIDVDGNFGDLVHIYVSTEGQGGTGVAQVSISVGKFENINGALVQTVTFTPNDQTSMFRDMIAEKSAYDENGGDDWALEYLYTEYPFEIPGWNQYGVDNYQFEAKPNYEYYALAVAQNADGKWGPLVKKLFTTPASPSAVAPAKTAVVPQRINAKQQRTAVVPVKRGLQLVK